MITDALEEALKPAETPMAELPYFVVREYPDAGLRTKCAPLLEPVKDNAQLQTLFNVLEKTMDAYGAAGLAGTQVGLFFRVVAIRVEKKALTMINPVITKASEKQDTESEGCLSFPGLFIKVKRPASVEVRYTNRGGEEVTRWFHGIEAREAQHEIDHIDGLTFLDRIPKFQRAGMLEKMRLNQRKQKSQQKAVQTYIKKIVAEAKANQGKVKVDATLNYGTPMPQEQAETGT